MFIPEMNFSDNSKTLFLCLGDMSPRSSLFLQLQPLWKRAPALQDLLTLAWPCLPVLEVDISTILQGRFFSTTKPFLRRAEHCMGKVADAPASPVSKSSSASAMPAVEINTQDADIQICPDSEMIY